MQSAGAEGTEGTYFSFYLSFLLLVATDEDLGIDVGFRARKLSTRLRPP